MRLFLLILLFVCSTLSSAQAATVNKPEKLLEKTRILWVSNVTVDDKAGDPNAVSSNLDSYLKRLGFTSLPGRTNAKLAKKCDVKKMLGGEYCEAITNGDADIIVAVDAAIKSQRPDRKGLLGVKVMMEFRLFRTDTRKQFGKMKQLPFAKGKSQDKAIRTAIRKVHEPISVLFSKTTNATLAMREITAEVSITGLPNKDVIDDMLQVLPRVEGLKELRVLELGAPSAKFRLTYAKTYLNSLVNRINQTQGVAVTLTIDGPNRIRGTYDAARAFYQIFSVTDVVNKTRDSSRNGLCAEITEILEKELSELPYAYADRPEKKRLPSNINKAKREMKDYLGGQLVVTGTLKKGRQGPSLIVEVHHVKWGRLVRHTIESADLTTSWKSSIKSELDAKIIADLKKKLRRMDRTSADQLRAYLERNGRS